MHVHDIKNVYEYKNISMVLKSCNNTPVGGIKTWLWLLSYSYVCGVKHAYDKDMLYGLKIC